jgi:peptidyl-prolyl cis-trans isomerase B (cyclophilin B)
MTSQGSPPPTGTRPGQKSPTWLVPGVVGLSVLVIAGIVAAVLFLPAGNKKGGGGTAPVADAAARCVYTPNGEAPARQVPVPPGNPTFPGELIRARVETNLGQMVWELEASKAPCTVGALRSMAEAKYFDDSTCHRLVSTGIFVLQCGDPTGTGSGSPGYFYAEENLPTAKQVPYPKGSIAMAKTAQPNTTGSQFFINYQDSPLPPEYTYVGSVIRGLDLVEQVAKGGDDGSFGQAGGGKPKVTMTIKSITFY